MKKQYIVPVIEVVNLDVETVMTGSNQNIGVGDSYSTGTYEGDAPSRRGGWDDYENN